MTYKRMQKDELKLRAQIEQLLEQAKVADTAVSAEPDLDISAEVQRGEKHLPAIAVAKQRLEARQREANKAKGLLPLLVAEQRRYVFTSPVLKLSCATPDQSLASSSMTGPISCKVSVLS